MYVSTIKLVKLPPCPTIACIGGRKGIALTFLIGASVKDTCKCFSSIHYRLLPRSIGALDK